MTDQRELQLFAADMDGTLLDSHNQFNHEKFGRVIDLLGRQKKHFVLATGNQTMRIDRMFSRFDPQGSVISMVAENGAYIQQGRHRLWQSIIASNKVQRIYDLLPDLNPRPALAVFAGENVSFAPDWQESVKKQNTQLFFSGTISDYYPNWQPVGSFQEIPVAIDKISLSWRENSGQEFLNLLHHDPLLADLRAPTSGFGAIDIVNGNANKAEGLKRLSASLHVSAEEMAAFGDGLNDLEMLQYVGQPYVMPNSQAELKAYFDHSRYLQADNNHDGVLDRILAILSN